jgi:hypothetical protein
MRGTALLPVGKCFHNKVKLNLEEIADIWAPCTVQVMEREKPDGHKTTVFVVGSGHGGYDRSFPVVHDQTHAFLGHYTQFAEVQLDKDGNIIKMSMGDRAIPKAAPVHVYK